MPFFGVIWAFFRFLTNLRNKKIKYSTSHPLLHLQPEDPESKPTKNKQAPLNANFNSHLLFSSCCPTSEAAATLSQEKMDNSATRLVKPRGRRLCSLALRRHRTLAGPPPSLPPPCFFFVVSRVKHSSKTRLASFGGQAEQWRRSSSGRRSLPASL